ncbi:aldo/keto reductase [Agrobacterium tumefaciens]|uniref:aldo/keto reductase n=1 Tax=Agrobacterium tumefaciens TaxID=358 RepID=UPI00287DA00F|nr:aldo/keto reductase [Agrobacterium tumefaciens]MDS7597765.1 aldo/keto reductase [Agrobacterium tumefaciens]
MQYKIFGRTGLRVSTLALGTGNFGTRWGHGADRDEARRIYEAYRAAGGNFIDTANNYQFGESETLVGEFITSDRDNIVLATKYSLPDAPDAGLQMTGNSRRTMVRSVEASLKRLGTDAIDLLWVHMPDGVTPIEEIARGLDDLVRSGKIIYAGLSDFPAWRISAAATLAEMRGWAGISAVQLEYSLVERSAERELLPMSDAFDLGVVGWSPLGGGLLTGKYRRGESGRAQGLGVLTHDESDARKTATVDALLSLADQIGVSPGQIAIAWVKTKGVLPIIGPRTAAQIDDNVGADTLTLEPDQILQLDAASSIDLGFPHQMLADTANISLLSAGMADRIRPLRHPVR